METPPPKHDRSPSASRAVDELQRTYSRLAVASSSRCSTNLDAISASKDRRGEAILRTYGPPPADHAGGHKGGHGRCG